MDNSIPFVILIGSACALYLLVRWYKSLVYKGDKAENVKTKTVSNSCKSTSRGRSSGRLRSDDSCVRDAIIIAAATSSDDCGSSDRSSSSSCTSSD